MSKWDKRFLELAEFVSRWSKDKSTQVGCVIVGPDKRVRSLGYNGLPSGLNDNIPERDERPQKYYWYEHGERNAVYNAVLIGASIKGCVAYMNTPPCADCARALIQAGIATIRVKQMEPSHEGWKESCSVGVEMLLESGVAVEVVDD